MNRHDRHRDDGPGPLAAQQLHARFLAYGPNDRLCLEAAAVLFHHPLTARLAGRPRFRRADPQAVHDAVLIALLEYGENPTAYDPDAGRALADHLALAAERNLLNLLRSDARRRGREREAAARADRKRAASVELDSPAGNAIREEEARRQDDERQRAFALLTDPADRRVFELQLAGERRTTAFAAVLGIGHLPADEQKRQVKRVKDRIDKALRRGLGR